MSFLAEIKRRKIFRVAAAYIVGAAPIIAFVNDIAGALPVSAPHQETIKDAIIYVLAGGFPLALVLGWLFDWTPEGIVRDTGPKDSAGALTGQGADAAIGDRPKIHSQSLGEIIASGTLSASRMSRLAVRIADALAGMHENDAVHGALTPANILVTGDDQVELTDGGREAGLTSSEAAQVSAYLAPESARGERAGFHADQFSFGSILYEMATGRRAFVGANKDETLAAVMRADPAPVSRFNADVPMPLQWVIERCLAKSPDDRYASTRELRDDLASIAESVAVATSARFAPKHNLPAQRTRLIGRETELGEVAALVLDEANRVVTLTGPGGIGKTRMLVELGRELLPSFEGGAFFVALDRVQDAELVTSEIAGTLGVQAASDRSVDEVLQHHVRQFLVAPTLLLIDNFEHVVDAAPRLSELVEASELIKIVVTSRAALRIYGEHEYRLHPLLLADDGASTKRLAESPAVRLFLDRAVSLPDDLDADRLRIVADICARLDGLPLAIELAAARTKILSLESLGERISEPLELLAGGPRDRPARQQTLRATLEWSYALLDDDQQKVFRRFGVFVGGATLEAVEAACNVDADIGTGVIEAVESLIDNSLLRPMDPAGAESRFMMLETMREYAVLQLAEAGEEARTRRAHAAYCLVLAGESAYAQTASAWEALYDRLDRESGNLRAALDFLIESRDGDWGWTLALSLIHYWVRRAQVSEGYERMLKLLPFANEGSEQRAWALVSIGDILGQMGRNTEADHYHTAALTLARELGNGPCVLRCLNALAVQTRQMGDMERTEAFHREALEMAREQGAPPAVLGGVLSNYADLAMIRGDFDLAQRLHEETSQLFIEVEDEAALAWSLNRLGDVARERGDLETARARYEESLAKFRGLGEKAGTAGSLYDLATSLAHLGNCDEAEKLDSEALAIYRELGQIVDYPRVLEALSRCAFESGEAARALVLAGSAAAMRQTLSLPARGVSQEAIDRCVDAARLQLTDVEATKCWMDGWRMQPEQAAAFALRQPGDASASQEG